MLCIRKLLNSQRSKLLFLYIGKNFLRAQCAGQIRQFIQPGEQPLLRALADCHLFSIPNDKHRALLNPPCLRLAFYRKIHHAPLCSRKTHLTPRTFLTERCAVRHTDRRPKLHHRLVERAGNIFIAKGTPKSLRNRKIPHHGSQLCLNCTAERLFHDVGIVRRHTRQDPQHISVYRRHRYPIGDRCDGTRCVGTDPF